MVHIAMTCQVVKKLICQVMSLVNISEEGPEAEDEDYHWEEHL
jgi:hypothetical protein